MGKDRKVNKDYNFRNSCNFLIVAILLDLKHRVRLEKLHLFYLPAKIFNLKIFEPP